MDNVQIKSFKGLSSILVGNLVKNELNANTKCRYQRPCVVC